ncbi:hypothetical protein FSP39_020457 [Pinctada imbricata]|uniref:SRCR domain-containing protein n=1 Tax=Pinctada imbricata TaxID=66713 RepID=A0AA88Y604_PINIB|nr:hypothetical protein FSP39_020457 [Pinctada imbricata]
MNGTWKTLCAWPKFGDGDATVACRELGYSRGLMLPLAAFGTFSAEYTAPFKGCSGQETSFSACNFDENYTPNVCGTQNTYYGSIWCTNETVTDLGLSVKILPVDESNTTRSFGPIRISARGQVGQICTSYWSEEDANVTCFELGYRGGVTTVYPATDSEPFLLTGIQCTGSERRLADCYTEVQICYDSGLRAGVVCFDRSEPVVHLEFKENDYGRVIIEVDGRNGTICNDQFNSLDAEVVCRQMGYVTGAEMHDGWDMDHNCTSGEAAVFCYDSVRIALGQTNDEVSMGLVEVYQDRFWTTLCSTEFDKNDADVVCRQLGYPKSKVLLPGIFGRPYHALYTTSIRCHGNETSLLDCPHVIGSCRSYDYATIICIKDMVSDDMSLSLDNNVGGRVIATQYGIRGTVCRTGWDNRDARVVCRMYNYQGGQVYGTQEVTNRYRPVWVFDVQCSGQEQDAFQCNVNFNVTPECGTDKLDAGVICYNGSGMSIRLVGGSNSNEGRVEVSRDGQWGTICDNSWTTYDAHVVCRQVGFAGGDARRGSRYGRGSGPVYMDNLKCRGTEETIFECSNLGWNVAATTCSPHTKDAGVYCYPWERLSMVYFGAVEFWMDNRYGAVCADTFNDNAAAVVCRALGYQYAVRLCCSAVGDIGLDYSLIGVNCRGNETSLHQCPKLRQQTECNSGYAAVFCTRNNPQFSSISSRIPSNGRGLVQMNYIYKDGYVCAENFTDADARVVCRESNYPYALAIRHNTSDFGHTYEIRWTNGLGCDGQETRVSECPALRIGELGQCNQKLSAGVLCSISSQTFDVRLQNGTSGREGRVELLVNGIWGSLCTSELTDNEARVICKQLNKRDGVALSAGHFGNTGSAMFDSLTCNGEESDILDCVVSVASSGGTCTKSAAVRCYETVRLVESDIIEFGRLEMWHESSWTPVCDAMFNDTEASVVCRYLGYATGKSVCCSALGALTIDKQIKISRLSCTGTESNPQFCSKEINACSSRNYASVYCMTSVKTDNATLTFPGTMPYGALTVNRHGLEGHICLDGFDDTDATIACESLNYGYGRKLKVMKRRRYPIIMGQVVCPQAISEFKFCQYNTFGTDPMCTSSDDVAGAICYNNELKFLIDEYRPLEGSVKLQVDTRTLTLMPPTSLISLLSSYVGIWAMLGVRLSMERTGRRIPLPYTADVRIVNGGQSYGAVELYKEDAWGTVCPETFDSVAAGIVCISLGYTSGIPICCSTFGSVQVRPTVRRLSCGGTESSLSDCNMNFDVSGVQCDNDWGYASVACLNGNMPSDFSVSIRDQSYFGDVILTYMNIPGRICQDGWDDKDAQVVCRQLNYVTGKAYGYYVEEGATSGGPYWMTEVSCSGSERLLSECGYSRLGSVTECKSRHYAGVLCFDNQGLYYRISGGDPNGRSGRVELFLNSVWGTVCDTYWDGPDARALCKYFGYKEGDPYTGSYRVSTTLSSIYETNYGCTGNEASISECPHSGWFQTTSPRCLDHKNDAGVFCYENDYGGVGREKTEGPVLIYMENTWYLVCDNNFDDTAAAVVCRQLGFADGYSKCCDAHGSISVPVWRNNTFNCRDSSQSVDDCLIDQECKVRGVRIGDVFYHTTTT